MSVRRIFLMFAVIMSAAFASGAALASSGDKSALWAALRDGKAFAIMRHAIAPGFSDPARFKINDCTTQRNLSAEGRAQATKIGARFKSNGIGAAEVYASQWCRCQETAKLLGIGAVQSLPPLNSFFEAMNKSDEQTRALKDWMSKRTLRKPLVLVTHQVNISALTGSYTRSGETIVARLLADGSVKVLGSLD